MDVHSAEQKYTCIAVVVHAGDTPHAGHYYCFGKLGSRWYKFDDETVTLLEDVEVEFGRVSHGADTAYLLFYCASQRLNVQQQDEPINLPPIGAINRDQQQKCLNICFANAVLQALHTVQAAIGPLISPGTDAAQQHPVFDNLQALLDKLSERSGPVDARKLLEEMQAREQHVGEWTSQKQQVRARAYCYYSRALTVVSLARSPPLARAGRSGVSGKIARSAAS